MESGSLEFKFYPICHIPNYRMDIPVRSTCYITAFKPITGKKTSGVRRVSADPTANSQLMGLAKKKKILSKRKKPQNSAINMKNSKFGKNLTM